MARNQFIDPKGVRPTYDWAINHSEEDNAGKTRNVEKTAPTSGTGLVRQQGDETPLILRYKGTILHKAQVTEMIAWWTLCASQTIYFKDFAGDEYEVLITSFNPVRLSTIRNPRDFPNMPLWYYKYDLEMDVVAIRAGVWVGVNP